MTKEMMEVKREELPKLRLKLTVKTATERPETQAEDIESTVLSKQRREKRKSKGFADMPTSPKLTISMRRPSVDKTPSVDVVGDVSATPAVASMVRKSGPLKRKPIPNLDYPANQKRKTRFSSHMLKSLKPQPSQSVGRTSFPLLAGAGEVSAASLILQQQQGSYRVPIAPLVSHQVNAPPAERDEDRILKNLLTESFQARMHRLSTDLASWRRPFADTNDAANRLWPFWELLAPAELTNNPAYRLAGVKVGENPQECHIRQRREYAGLVDKFVDVLVKERSKRIPAELQLLEQKLCLEEEKFLCAKLRSEYRANRN